MLNSKNFDEFLSSTPEQVMTFLNSKMTSPPISFNETSRFSNNNGLYFIFLDEVILYIGIADTQDIKKR